MNLPAIPAIAAALFFLLPCTAAAQEAPEAVYAKFHRALLAGNMDELNRYGTASGGAELARMSPEERKTVLELVKKIMPRSYTITSRQLSRDGDRYTMTVTGTGASLLGGKPEPQNGTIRMVKQGGVWKVDETSWNNTSEIASPPPPPRAADSAPMQSAPHSQPAQAPRPASKAPERSLGAAKQPCVYKPVMTSEDLELCR